MILRNLGSSAVAGALVLLAVSCGSSEKDPAGAGGSGATGGAATSAGGSTSTSGATSVAGAANMGGSTASGGASASGGGGGMPGPGNFGCPAQKPEASSACMRGGNLPACTYDDGGCVCQDGAWTCYADADCPAAAPADDAACTLTGMACGYGDVNCTCSMGGEWTCASPCPMAEPGADASCRRAENSTCRYNMGTLVGGFGMADTTCSCASGKFSCFSQEDCPAAAPAQMSACTTATLGCMYDDRQCTCTGGAWNCQTSCPAAPPSDGAECLRPENATCRYNMDMLVQGGFGQADTTCACSDNKFSCFGQEDCPASAPVDGATCEFSTLSCDWEATGCTCNNGMWACTTDCPAAPHDGL